MAYVSTEEKKELSVGIKKVLKKYGMKGSIARGSTKSTIVVNVKSGPIDFNMERMHEDVNVYHIDRDYKGTAKNFLTELLSAMKGENYYNKDDWQVDHFDRSHYTDINIGRYDKPYIRTPKIKMPKSKLNKKYRR
tara:strand:+ start:2223 stop:2627 length:405 start_codon:yes stop_codon:yes gene_type:complete